MNKNPPQAVAVKRKPGRPAIAGLKRRNVTIDESSAETLRAFGDGDLSLGIRRAAAHISQSSNR